MHLTGIILAAGSSRRMGQPKALLRYRGMTFVDTLRSRLSPWCRRVLVVGAPDSVFPADVVNPDPSRGMLSSLQCALAHIAPDDAGFLFTPVDLPAIQASTVERMIGQWAGEALCIPRTGGRRGHPVLAARSMITEFLAEQESPRHLIERHASEILYVDVDDPGIRFDTDTPEDYERLVANG